ncbi:MAG TPA: phosphate ABC transporter substrate-binding protein PstS [Elusimicrobiota bacterium]|nr:phosphate ABC transporter substrate-binding protein PstS [Elusimicrobiota bacterium]
MNRSFIAVLAAAALAAPVPLLAATLNGAGSTFAFPIYSKWSDEYHKVKPDLQINYQSIGSGGGIRQFTEKTVDFGATDGPMTDEQIAKAGGKVLQLPTVLGADIPVFNLDGIDGLRFDGPTLARIFLGKIANWNDPALAKLNPGVKLPDQAITVVHRSDGSGTTYCWVDYLSKVSPEWEKTVGRGTSVDWPVGLGGKGNEGVSGIVKQTPGAIGYVELIYALQNKMPFGSVKNRAGKFVKASIAGVTAAAAGAARHMPKDYRISITDAPGAKAYPISTFTWLLVYPKNDDAAKGAELKAFMRWALKDGQALAPALGYAPLPSAVKTMVAKSVETIR